MLNLHETFFHLLFFDLLDDFVERGEMSAVEADLRKMSFIEQEHITEDELRLMARQQGKTKTTTANTIHTRRKETQYGQETEVKRKA